MKIEVDMDKLMNQELISEQITPPIMQKSLPQMETIKPVRAFHKRAGSLSIEGPSNPGVS